MNALLELDGRAEFDSGGEEVEEQPAAYGLRAAGAGEARIYDAADGAGVAGGC